MSVLSLCLIHPQTFPYICLFFPLIHLISSTFTGKIDTNWLELWGFPRSAVGKESACNAGALVRFPGWEYPLQKEMATHSCILAWRIPWTEEPGRPQSIGSQRVGHDLATSLFRDCDASLPVSPATACQVIHTGLRPSGESAGCFTTETWLQLHKEEDKFFYKRWFSTN